MYFFLHFARLAIRQTVQAITATAFYNATISVYAPKFRCEFAVFFSYPYFLWFFFRRTVSAAQ
jgi:hypothetical protein